MYWRADATSWYVIRAAGFGGRGTPETLGGGTMAAIVGKVAIVKEVIQQYCITWECGTKTHGPNMGSFAMPDSFYGYSRMKTLAKNLHQIAPKHLGNTQFCKSSLIFLPHDLAK